MKIRKKSFSNRCMWILWENVNFAATVLRQGSRNCILFSGGVLRGGGTKISLNSLNFSNIMLKHGCLDTFCASQSFHNTRVFISNIPLDNSFYGFYFILWRLQAPFSDWIFTKLWNMTLFTCLLFFIAAAGAFFQWILTPIKNIYSFRLFVLL